MNQITLKIETSVIGTEPTNTVDARELHKNLGVRKDFSDWIKGQITNLGLEERVDYMILPLKGESSLGHGGNRRSIDYTLTLDTAKHISMASRTPRGKEVRNYFIEAEKKLTQIGEAYRAQPQNQTIDLSPIIAIMEAQTRIMETMQMQSTIALSLIDSISQTQEHLLWGMRLINGKAGMILDEVAPRFRYDGSPMIKDTRMSSEQRGILYSAVTTRAAYLAEAFDIKTDVIAAAIFAGLKSRFRYSHYTDICEHEFDEAIEFANAFEIMR